MTITLMLWVGRLCHQIFPLFNICGMNLVAKIMQGPIHHGRYRKWQAVYQLNGRTFLNKQIEYYFI